MTLTDLWTALGLMGVLEGVLYALFPGHVKRMMAYALAQPEDVLRMTGLTVGFLSVAFLWMLRS